MSLTKICTVCKEEKNIDDFYNYKAAKDSKSYRCKLCDYKARKKWLENNPEKSRESSKDRQLKYKYGITLKEYDILLDKQGGVCAICGATENKSAYGKNVTSSFSVDHCHSTGKVRGLLCNQCNRGLGMLGDTIESLEKALKYLRDTH